MINLSRKLFFILFIFLSLPLFSQLQRDIFPFSREFKRGGFYISPQATVSIGNSVEGSSQIADSSYNYKTTGRGKWGYGLEIGWFHTFEGYKVGDYFEGGIAYRMFQGAAEHEGEYIRPNDVPVPIESENEFKIQTLVASLRAVDVLELENHNFFTFGIGINYNYVFSESIERENTYPNSYEEFLETNSAQAHFQLGYGFRLTKYLMLVPTVETPLLTVYPTEDINPAFSFFSAKYHPIIIGLKLMVRRKDPANCNAPTLMNPPQ